MKGRLTNPGCRLQRIQVAASIAAALTVTSGLLLFSTTLPAGAQTGTTSPTSATIVGKVRELNTSNVEIRQVAFAPTGGWAILHGTNDATWVQAPQAFGDKLRELIGASTQVRFVAFSSGGGWVILHGANEVTWNGIPPGAADKIRQLYQAGTQMKLIAFNGSGGWIILQGRNGASWDGIQ